MARLRPEQLLVGGHQWHCVRPGLYRSDDGQFSIRAHGGGVFRWQLWKLGESQPRHEATALGEMLRDLGGLMPVDYRGECRTCKTRSSTQWWCCPHCPAVVCDLCQSRPGHGDRHCIAAPKRPMRGPYPSWDAAYEERS